MDPFRPIPTPPSYYWRTIRDRGVPLLVFAGVIIAVALLWKRAADSTGFVGHAEVIQVSINSPDAGMLTNLFVSEFQELKAGDAVAEIITTDPRLAPARLAVMRHKMHLLELETEPVLNRQRAMLDYERMTVDCARIRAELAMAKVNLESAKSELERNEKLHKEGLLSAESYDRYKDQKQRLEAEVKEKSDIVATTEKAISRLNYRTNASVSGEENDRIQQALQVQEERVRLFGEKMKPIQLQAPIDGVVTFVHRRAGEEILPGEPIVTITSQKAQRIVGYLPQGFNQVPKAGMTVKVMTRNTKRRTALAKVLAVAPHYQSLTNSLVPPLLVRPTVVPQLGRMISISLPSELGLLPGEPVDLKLMVEQPTSGTLPGSPQTR